MIWTEHAFTVLENLRLIAASVDQHYRDDPANAAAIREAAAKATEAATLAGSVQWQNNQEIFRAWRAAVPGPIRCGKAVMASAHDIVFTDGASVISTINKLVSPNDDGQFEGDHSPRRRRKPMSLKQLAAGENPLTTVDAKLIDAATKVIDMRLGREQLEELNAILCLEATAASVVRSGGGDKDPNTSINDQRIKFENEWRSTHEDFDPRKPEHREDFLAAYRMLYPDDKQGTMKAFRNTRQSGKANGRTTD